MESNEVCVGHPDVVAVGRCDRCGRAICRLCSFTVGLRELCPNCIASGADPDLQKRAASRALWSVLLAVVTALGFVALMAIGAAGVDEKSSDALAGVLGMVILGCGLAGLTLGLIGREHGRRTGSPLAIIGTIANAVMLAVFAVMCVVGLAM